MFLPSLSRLLQRAYPLSRRGPGRAFREANRFRPWAEVLEDRTLPAAFTWVNAAGGNWDDGNNWRDGQGMPGVPGANDSASIPISNIAITQTPASHQIASLSVTGTGTLALAVTLVVTGSVSSQGTLALSAGQVFEGSFSSETVKLGGSLHVGGNFTTQTLVMNGGTLSNTTVNGNVQVTAAGGTLSADVINGDVDMTAAAASLTVANGLTLNGTLTMGNGTGNNANKLVFTNTETLGGNGTVQMGTSSANQVFTTGTGTTLTLAPSVAVHGSGALSGTIINNGSITADATGGTLSLLGTWTNHGTIAVASGSTLNLGGNGSWSSGSNSSLGVTSSVVNFTGNLTLGIPLTLAAGVFNLAGGTLSGGTVTEAGGVTLVVTSTASGFNNLVLNGNVDLTAAGAKLSISNGLTLNGTVTVGNSAGTTSATVAFTNTETIGGSGSFLLGGSASNALTSTGTTTFGPNLAIHGKSGSFSGGSIINQGMVAADGGTISINEVWTNSGTLKAQGGGTLNLNTSWTNTGGTFSADGGTFNINFHGTNTSSTTGTIEAKNGGTMNFGKNYSCDLTNTGATLLLTGDGSFRLGSGSIVGGTVTESGGAVLTETAGGYGLGGVTLNGNLDMTPVNNRMDVYNGLTLNGTISVGNSAGTTFGQLYFDTIETLSGNGDVMFGGNSSNEVAAIGGGGLTIGSGIKVHGKTGLVGHAAGPALSVNQGTIAADVAGGTITVIMSAGSSNSGTLAANGGTLSVGTNFNGYWTNTGTVKADGTTLTVVTVTWTNNGTALAQNGGTLSASTPTNYSNGTLTGGTWEVFNNSTLRVIMSPGVVTNKAAILLDGPNAHFYRDAGTSDALAPLASNPADSTFTVQNGSTFTTAGDFTNNGTLNVKAGSTFTVKGSLTNFDSGTLTGGTYNIAGTLQFTNAAIVTNAATIVLDGASAQIIDQSGNDALGPNLALNAAAGSFTIQNGANFTTAGDFENDGTLKLGNNSTFIVSGVDTDTGTLTVLAGGTLSLAGGGSASGAVSDAGTLTVAAGTTFTVSGAYSQTGTLQVASAATVTLSGSFSNFASGTLSGGTYVIAGVFQFTGAAIATNAASIVLDGTGAQITDLVGNDALAGTFATNKGSFSLLDRAAFTTASDFENDGTLVVGAGSTFSVSGNFTQGSAATLDLQLGGTSAGQFGTLAVTGTAKLAGTLLDTPVNGYQPMSGDTFAILTYGARSGDFATGPAGFDRSFDDVNGVMTLVAQ
jgi:cytoskeletal protein CcmA (bactofilin family)